MTLTKTRQLTSEEQEQETRRYLDLLKENMHPRHMPDCGRWTPLVVIVKDACEQANGDRAIVYESTLASLTASNKEFKAMLEGKSQGQTKEVKLDDSVYVPPLPEHVKLSPELSIGACTWLDEYVAYSKKRSPEGYDDFHEACGLWVLSTIAGRRIKIPLDDQYTPLMIVLIAAPGTYAKTTTANKAVNVLQAARLDWLLGNDRTTPSKLLTDMVGEPPKNYDDLTAEKQYDTQKELAMSAQRGWRYGEVGELFKALAKGGGVMDDLKGLILQLDDCLDKFRYGTQTRGNEQIDKPYLAMLGDTTPASIRSCAKAGSDFWNDGFFSRFVFVTPPADTGKDDPFGLGIYPVPTYLSQPLKDWHKHLGIPTYAIEVKRDEKNKVTGLYGVRGDLPETIIDLDDDVYYAWIRYRSAMKLIPREIHNEDIAASYIRLAVKAIRVAALLASLDGSTTIQMRHYAKAQEIAERWRKSLHELYSQVNRSHEPSMNKKLEEDILRVVKKLDEQGKPPTVRDMTRYITKTDVGKLKLVVNDLVRNRLLQEDKSFKSPRYSIQVEDE